MGSATEYEINEDTYNAAVNNNTVHHMTGTQEAVLG